MSREDGASASQPLPVVPRVGGKRSGRTILFPNWDPITIPLLAASLKRSGLDIRVLEETPVLIKEAMAANTGQCIPISAIAQEAVAYIDRHDLDPEHTSVWMLRSKWSCAVPEWNHRLIDGWAEEGMVGFQG